MTTFNYSIGLASLPKFVIGVHGSYYSYKTASSCNEPRSVQCWLSFAVKYDSFRKPEAPGSLENDFQCLFLMVTLLEMADTDSANIT